MKGIITVEEALDKGYRMIKIPSTIILLGFPIIGFVFAFFWKYNPYWVVITGFILGFILRALFVSYITVKWQEWAFSHVDDVHELKKAAVTEQYLCVEEKWFKKFSPKIQQRFNAPHVFADDFAVPSEVIIYRSSYILKILGVLTILFGTLFTLISLFAGIVIIFAGIAAIFLNNKLSESNKTKPPIITISNDGISTQSVAFHKWGDIHNEQIVLQRNGRNNHYFLTYDFSFTGTECINLINANIKIRYLNHILYVYRNRYIQNQKNLG